MKNRASLQQLRKEQEEEVAQVKQKVDPIWEGEDVVCIASGPSLNDEDLDYLNGRKCRVIVVNDNYQLYPDADVLYACDGKWWDWHWSKVKEQFDGEKWTLDVKASDKYGINLLKQGAEPGLSSSPEKLNTGNYAGCSGGGNSGFQAINLAYLFGAKRIILTGYDMKIASNGSSHWFGDHPDGVRSHYQRMVHSFDPIKKQGLVEVVNCTRETELTCFKIANLRNVL